MPLYSDLYSSPSTSSYGLYMPISTYSNHSSLLGSSSFRAPVIPKTIPRYPRTYKPHLGTISETQVISPIRTKFSPQLLLQHHSSPNYKIQKPIKINTADIDVSFNKYRKYDRDRKPPPLTTSEVKKSPEKMKSPSPPTQTIAVAETTKEEVPSDTGEFKPIRRDRALVRLHTVHKKDSPRRNLGPNDGKSWRQNIYGEFKDPDIKQKNNSKQSPGEKLIDKFLIRTEDEERRLQQEGRKIPRRVSVKKQNFHDICRVISSDTISEDLNPGQPEDIVRRQSKQLSEDVFKQIRRNSAEILKENVEILEDMLRQENLLEDENNNSVMEVEKPKKKKVTKKKSNEKLVLEGEVPRSTIQRRGTQKKYRRTSTDSSILSDVSLDEEREKAFQEAIRDISQVEVEEIKIKPKPKITATVDIDESPTWKAVIDNVEIIESPNWQKPKKFKYNVIVEEVHDEPVAVPNNQHLPQLKLSLSNSALAMKREKSKSPQPQSPGEEKILDLKKLSQPGAVFNLRMHEGNMDKISEDVNLDKKGSKSSNIPKASEKVDGAKVESPKTPVKDKESPKVPESPKGFNKQIGKSQSSPKLNEELKKPMVQNKSPLASKEENKSGENFWETIGTRESVCFDNRRKKLHEKRLAMLIREEDDEEQDANNNSTTGPIWARKFEAKPKAMESESKNEEKPKLEVKSPEKSPKSEEISKVSLDDKAKVQEKSKIPELKSKPKIEETKLNNKLEEPKILEKSGDKSAMIPEKTKLNEVNLKIQEKQKAIKVLEAKVNGMPKSEEKPLVTNLETKLEEKSKVSDTKPKVLNKSISLLNEKVEKVKTIEKAKSMEESTVVKKESKLPEPIKKIEVKNKLVKETSIEIEKKPEVPMKLEVNKVLIKEVKQNGKLDKIEVPKVKEDLKPKVVEENKKVEEQTVKKVTEDKVVTKKPVEEKVPVKKLTEEKEKPEGKKTTEEKPEVKKIIEDKPEGKKIIEDKPEGKKATEEKLLAKKPVEEKLEVKKFAETKVEIKKSSVEEKPEIKKFLEEKKSAEEKPIMKKPVEEKIIPKKPTEEKSEVKKLPEKKVEIKKSSVEEKPETKKSSEEKISNVHIHAKQITIDLSDGREFIIEIKKPTEEKSIMKKPVEEKTIPKKPTEETKVETKKSSLETKKSAEDKKETKKSTEDKLILKKPVEEKEKISENKVEIKKSSVEEKQETKKSLEEKPETKKSSEEKPKLNKDKEAPPKTLKKEKSQESPKKPQLTKDKSKEDKEESKPKDKKPQKQEELPSKNKFEAAKLETKETNVTPTPTLTPLVAPKKIISKRSLVNKSGVADPDLEVFKPPTPPPVKTPSPPKFIPLQSNRLSAFMNPYLRRQEFDEKGAKILYARPKTIRSRHYPKARQIIKQEAEDDEDDDDDEEEEEETVEETSSSEEATSSEEESDDDDSDEDEDDDDDDIDYDALNDVWGYGSIGASTSSADSGFHSGTKGKRKGCSERDSPTSNPARNPAMEIDPEEFSHSSTFAGFQRSGRITPPATTIPKFCKYNVEDFNFLKVLGKGSFGKVLLAELKDSEYYYAIKCLKKDVVLEDDDVECTLIERKVLALGTKHPYLCHLLCTFQTDSHLFFVMEYLNGGDLMFHIQQCGRFPEPRARFYAAEIMSGLKFLHTKGIVYRDLKLDNILLDFDGHVRIADFGMCKLQIFLDRMADTFCGTPDYMAPEILKGQHYNQNVDWWSFGVLLYEMLIGQSPFSGCDEDELFWSICNERPVLPQFLSKESISILTLLLEKDATKRLGNKFCEHGDIQDQAFFRPVDWELLNLRQLEPPFRPNLQHPLDTKYFDRTFTAEKPKLTPIEANILESMDQTQFQGFSYTNPNATDR